jgi:hypothetical protein
MLVTGLAGTFLGSIGEKLYGSSDNINSIKVELRKVNDKVASNTNTNTNTNTQYSTSSQVSVTISELTKNTRSELKLLKVDRNHKDDQTV